MCDNEALSGNIKTHEAGSTLQSVRMEEPSGTIVGLKPISPLDVALRTTEVLRGEGKFSSSIERTTLPVAEIGKPYEQFVKLVSVNNGFAGKIEIASVVSNSNDISIVDKDLKSGIVQIAGTAKSPDDVKFTVTYGIVDVHGTQLAPSMLEAILVLKIAPDPALEAERRFIEDVALLEQEFGKLDLRVGEEISEIKFDIPDFTKSYEKYVKLNSIKPNQEAVKFRISDGNCGTFTMSGILKTPEKLVLTLNYSLLTALGVKEKARIFNVDSKIKPERAYGDEEELKKTVSGRAIRRIQSGHDCDEIIDLGVLKQFVDRGTISIDGYQLSDPTLRCDAVEGTYDVKVFGQPVTEPNKTVSVFVRYVLHTKLDGDIQRELEIPVFLILADPKTMFKDLPTDPAAPYQSPNTDDVAIVNERVIIAASKRGRSHAHEGKFRDDNFKVEYLDPFGWYIVAVSDGAGSAEYSREGSRIVCESFCTLVKQQLVKLETDGKYTGLGGKEKIELLKKIVLASVYEGVKNINAAAEAKNEPRKKYAATLLAYILKKIGDEWLMVSIGIGDGFIAVLSKDQHGVPTFTAMSEPDGGEFVGMTRFVTMDEVWTDNPLKRVRVLKTADFDMILSMTDGVSDPWFETDNNLQNPEMWQKLRMEIEKSVPFEKRSKETSKALLDWLDFYIKANHDDRTIAILY